MADYKKLIPTILKWEGGYAGNIDGCGCTMKGVTLTTFRNYFGRAKTCKDLRNITDAQWEHIFIKGYWSKWKADSIESQSIANLLVDWVFTSGVYGIRYPQAVLGVEPDGKVGPITLAAINNHPDKKKLFQQLWERRKKHFETIASKNPSKKKFLTGWLRRLNDFKYE
jgi:lysozyme family protein